MASVCYTPVMNKVENRLVIYSMKILRVLLKGSTHVNDIVKQTSSDKTYVLKVIKILQHERLIIETKDDRHSQKKIKQLTDLGQELTKLMENVDDYKNSYSKLMERRKKYFTSSEIKKAYSVVEDDIRAHGKTWKKIAWTSNKADLYLYGVRGASLLEYEATIHISNILIFRFASLQKRFDLLKLTKAIINKIITDTMTYQLKLVLSEILDDGSQMMTGELARHTDIITSLPARLAEYPLFTNKAISEESKNMLAQIFSLLRPSENDIEVHINKVKKYIEQVERFKQHYSNDNLDIPLTISLRLENLKSVLAFYERRNE
jgi:DNA-binding HxlR family transcriptional regulator